MAILHAAALQGTEIVPWSFKGYKGWRTEGVGVASRDGGTLISMSSGVASASWRTIVPLSGKPTRLDLQTTLTLKSPTPSFGPWLTRLTPTGLPFRQGRRTGSVMCASGRSYTGTMGSRQSERMVRVYDKGVEDDSHPAGQRWRVEAEFKGSAARRHWASLSQAVSPAGYCSSAAWDSLTSFGGQLPEGFRPESTPPAPIAERSSRLTADLQYLERYVVPLLRRLALRGKGELAWQTLEKALGSHRIPPPGFRRRPDTLPS